MHHHPARAMYDQLEDTLSSITMQLRTAIELDAGIPPRGNGKTMPPGNPLHRGTGRARQVSAEIGSVLLDPLGLAATVEWHVRQFQKCTGIHCELTMPAMAGMQARARIHKGFCDLASAQGGGTTVTVSLPIQRPEPPPPPASGTAPSPRSSLRLSMAVHQWRCKTGSRSIIRKGFSSGYSHR